jgi:outer membrane protein TolC
VVGVAKSAVVRRAFCGLVLGALLAAQPASSRAEQVEVVTLPTLERLVENAPELRLAMSDARYASAKIASHRSLNAPQFTVSTSGGRYRELVTNTLIRNYNGADLNFGVRVPVFGGYAEQGAFAQLGDELTARRFDVEEARLSVLHELRERYVDYWISVRRLEVTRKYLTSEPEVEGAVALRVRSGLSLRGEGLQSLAGYALAKSNVAHFAHDATAALDEMRRLTGLALTEFRPVEPVVTTGCHTREDFIQTTLAASPGLAMLQQQLDESRRFAAGRGSALQGTVTLTQGLVAQQGAQGAGRSTAVGFDLAIPFDSAAVVSTQRAVQAARADDIAARLKYETEHLRAEADDAWNDIAAAEVDVRVAENRIDTTRELMRESMLRYGSMASDTVEKVQVNRLGFYQSLLGKLDSEAALAKLRIAATGSKSDCPEVAPQLGDTSPEPPTTAAAANRALRVYAWNSGELLAGDWTNSKYWDRFTNLGIRRLMISLDASQIVDGQRPAFRNRLQSFIAAAGSADVDVDLLLGEPHWILPDQRSHLVSIVQEFADVPFHALDLDLEPAQLSAETRLSASDLQSDIVDTVRTIASISKWPLSLSANYRDFQSKPPSDSKCYACALQSSGVKEVVLMTYVSNPDRVAELVRPILQSHPAVSFAVAQSVEPTLPAANSYRSSSRPQFLNSMAHLNELLGGEHNFSGIAVQSYRDYRVMQP